MRTEIVLTLVAALSALPALPVRGEDAPRKPLRQAVRVSVAPAAPHGIFYENDPVTVTVTVENTLETPVTVGEKCEVARVQGRVRGEIGSYSLPPEKVEDVAIPKTAVPGKGKAQVPVTVTTKRMGCFLLVLELAGEKETARVPAGTFLRVRKPVEGFSRDSFLIVPHWGWGISKDTLWCVEALSRLGVKWVRATIRWPSLQSKEGQWDWSYADEFIELCRKHKVYVDALAVHSPNFALPNGRPVGRPGGSLDATPAPDKLEHWKEFFVQVTKRYGDVLRAWEVWNEPWEGGGVTEYGACGAHYRNMHQAAYEAVKSVDPGIIVGSNESEANCIDNLLCVPGFERFFDVGYVHQYNRYQSYGAEFFAKMGKECWDNESWNYGTGALEEPNALHMLLFQFSRGLRKAGPVTGGDMFGGDLFFDRKPWRHPNPVAASFAALNHFLEGTRPESRINPTCAPWIFVFKGAERAVAAVTGRIGLPGQSWDQQTRDGRMTLDTLGGALSAFDRHGDPLPTKDGKCEIPLTQSPCYVTARPERLVAMQKVLADAPVDGIVPVQVSMPDFVAPLENRPPVRIRMRNATNTPISGKAVLETPRGITLEQAAVDFGPLGAGQATELAFPVSAANPLPENKYLVKCRVETDKGTAQLEEVLSVAVFRQGTPQVDGDLGEWERLGAIPVCVTAGKFVPDPALTNWFPFKKWKEESGTGYFGRFAGTWDEANLYLMAEVNDPTAVRHPGPLTGTWFKMMDPPYSHVYAMGPKFVFSADQVQIALDCCPNEDTLLPPDDPNYRDGSFRNTDYEFGLMDTESDGALVWRYLAPGLRWHHYYPFSPRLPFDQGPVLGAKIVARRDDPKLLWTYEAAIPLTELKELKPEPGKVIRFSFRLNQDGRSHVDWSHGRSGCKMNSFGFHPDWVIDYSVETEWGFTK